VGSKLQAGPQTRSQLISVADEDAQLEQLLHLKVIEHQIEEFWADLVDLNQIF
jgi:hypothetical protein